MTLSEAKRLYSQGQQKLAAGDLQGAIAEFQQALQFNPNDYLALSGLGEVMLKLERYEDAIESSERCISLQPEEANGWYVKGYALDMLGRYQNAIASYEQALRRNPNDPLAWRDHGAALFMLHRYEESVVSFDKALQYESDNWIAWYGRGNSLYVLKRYKEAISSFDQVLHLNPNFPRVWSSRGAALNDYGRYQEALESAEIAIALAPEESQGWYIKGYALRRLSRYEDAIASHDRALELNPINSSAWRDRGYALIDLESYEEAVTSFERVLHYKPEDAEAWSNRGIALSQLEIYKEAIFSYDQALHYKPDDPQTLTNRGITLLNLERYAEAIAACEKALSLDDQLSFAWVNLGFATWGTQGFEAAIEKLDEAFLRLKKEPLQYSGDYGKLYFWKAFIYYDEGRKREDCFSLWRKSASFYQMALRSFDQAEFQEDYLDTLQSLTKVFLCLGQVEETEVLLAEGTERLQRLLDPEKMPSPGKRKLLALKFAGFDQLTVDRHIQAAHQLKDDAEINAKFKEALATAEKGKNACLSWLLYALSDEVTSPGYEEMQQLLSPGTAIAYWHLSPAALTTFVLKPGEPAPILIAAPSTTERPESLQRLLKLEAWMKEWDDQYQDYRHKGKEQRDANHSWRRDMAQRLFERQEEPGNLREILNIGAIAQHLDGINHLILMPHRDLHRFPLHALFSDRFTVSYLPSVQVGLNLKERQPANTSYLLSIENPVSDRSSSLAFPRVESQLISQTFQNTKLLRDAEATQEKVIQAFSEGCNVLHFSGHGNHHPENPQKSELLLAGTDGLTLQEICQHDLTRYDLVSLSACETALTGNQSITTEYVGLVSGFLRSGVAQVLSTLWVVESAVSALVMIEFYRRRGDRADAVALAQAIEWLRNLNREEFEAWRTERLAELSSALPREQRSKIKRTLDHASAQWDRIEQDSQRPYAWAAFTLSGGFF